MQHSLAHRAHSKVAPVSSGHARPSRLEASGWLRSVGALAPIVEPLLEGWDKLGVDVPVLVLEEYDVGPTAGGSKRDHQRRVLEGIADVPVVVSAVWLGSTETLVVRGAAEKILDGSFLRELGARLSARSLAVAIPAKDLLVVAALPLEAEALSRFAHEIAHLHHHAHSPLSPTLFEAEGGRLVGVIQEALTPHAPSRGLLGRLLGGRRIFH